MKFSTKKFNGDPVKTYKALMKKLNKDGYYKDIQKQRFYISKSQKKREALKIAVVRETRRRIKTEKKLEHLDSISYRATKKNNKRNNKQGRR